MHKNISVKNSHLKLKTTVSTTDAKTTSSHIIRDRPIYQYRLKRPKKTASVGVDKTLLYTSRMQTICARKHNEPSQDSYLATTVAGTFS